MKGVQRCPAGGIALLVSVLKGNNEGYVEWFAYVIVNGQVGWAPTNWVDKIV